MKNRNGYFSKSFDSSPTTDLSSVSSLSYISDKDCKTSDVKTLVSEKLSRRLQDAMQGLRIFDKQKNGKVLPESLHNVLNTFCYPLSQKEFYEIVQKEDIDENGQISYKPFLLRLTGERKSIHSAEKNKRTDLCSNENVEEIEVKMKKKISKNLKNFIRCMWLYDPNRDGLIQKHEFREVLENLCLTLTDEQFNKGSTGRSPLMFIDSLHPLDAIKKARDNWLWLLYDPNNRGVLNYKDFLLKLGARTESYKRIIPKDMKSKLKNASSLDSPNSKKEQRQTICAKLGRDDPDVQGQVLNNILEVFKKRVEKNFPVLLRTFRIKDASESGLISISVLHQVLNYFVMPMSTQLFKQILVSFNVPPAANKIQWYDFLKRVCINEDDSSCQRNIAYFPESNNWNTCKAIMEKLKKRGTSSDNFFKKSFTIIDQNNKRTITRAELKRTLNQYLLLPLTDDEFRQLMFTLDPGHTNVIDCQNFLSLFDSTLTEKNDLALKKEISEEMLEESISSHLMGEKLKAVFKKKFNKSLKDIVKAINAFDSEETGFMHVDDLRKILHSFCLPLTDSQFNEIFSSVPINSNKIFYTDFIKHYKKSPYEDEEKWALNVKKLTTVKDTVRKLDNDEIINYVKKTALTHREVFLKEFKDQDVCNLGIVRKEVLLKLLQKYMFRINDEQFNYLWEKLPKNEIGLLKYEEFMNECSNQPFHFLNNTGMTKDSRASSRASQYSYSSSARKSLQSTPLTNRKERPKTASSAMTCNTNTSIKSFYRPKSAASSNLSATSLQTNNYEMGEKHDNCSLKVEGLGYSILTGQQYKQFKELDFRSTGYSGRTNSSSDDTRSHQNIKTSLGVNNGDHDLKEKRITNDKNTENETQLFLNSIKLRWRDILRRCKQQDTENKNAIPWEKFLNILQRTGINWSPNIEHLMIMEHNIKAGFPINYWIFLKNMVLNLNFHQKNQKSHGKRTEVDEWMNQNDDATGLSKALLTYQDKIMKNKRDLRHAFRKVDREHTGSINALDFRKILALHKIHLSDENFFYIQDHFDPNLTEKIKYDEFLKSFV